MEPITTRNGRCPNCGKKATLIRLVAGGEVFHRSWRCNTCGWRHTPPIPPA